MGKAADSISSSVLVACYSILRRMKFCVGVGVCKTCAALDNHINNTQPLNRPGPQPWRPKTPNNRTPAE
eukprot:349588-Chlamydomonas_euryale.AAC.12